MPSHDKHLHAMRHSLAHIMANAIQHLWPNVKFGIGPVVDNGFYYDIDLGEQTLSEDDFSKIKNEMKLIIDANEPFEQFDMDILSAIDWATQQNQPYKLELLHDLQRAGTTSVKDLDPEELGLTTSRTSKVETVSFYRNGDFTDLCRGPHVSSTGQVGQFELLRLSGAYWRGKETNPQMQRVYGVAFTTTEELKKYLELLTEAKKRDHRRLGQELDLFVFSDLVGPGLPLFTPRGTVLRDELNKFSQELQAAAGYQRVTIPHITRVELYKVSGHFDKYPERFDVSSLESDDKFMMKPMNCPHHTQIYASRPRSYRELPIRYMETTMVYRDEKAGELHGLSRVRAATQDDSHAFCRPDQIEEEFEAIVQMVKKMYNDTLDMPFTVRLAFRDDSEKYLGNKELWESAQKSVTNIAEKLQLDYIIEEGEATFYGPKIEFIIRDSLKRQWQCATIQLDFVQPERFELEYIAEDGSKQRPVMIHKALLGSIERFLSVYIEHTGGKFPVWVAPEQVRVVTVNQEEATISFAQNFVKQASDHGIRLTIDNSNESVGKKIRAAELYKVPYTIVIGEKEIQSKEILPRVRNDLGPQPSQKQSIEKFIDKVVSETKLRNKS